MEEQTDKTYPLLRVKGIFNSNNRKKLTDNEYDAIKRYNLMITNDPEITEKQRIDYFQFLLSKQTEVQNNKPELYKQLCNLVKHLESLESLESLFSSDPDAVYKLHIGNNGPSSSNR